MSSMSTAAFSPPSERVGALAICRGVCRLLGEAGWGTLTEVTLATGRRVDVMALNRKGEILVVEVKSSVADFRSDRKWHEYRAFCDYFAFAVDPVFPQDLLPDDAGLIVADSYGAEMLRPSPCLALPGARRKHLSLRFGLVAAARLQQREDPPL